MAAENSQKIVLVHGWGGSFQGTWVDHGWADRIGATGADVVGINLQGHGVPAASHDPEEYAGIVEEFSEQVKHLRGAIGVGYSLGAKSVLQTAMRHPGVFKAVILIGMGNNTFRPLGASDLLAKCMREGLPDDAPAPLKRLVDDVYRVGNDREAMAACITRPQDDPILPGDLHSVDLPAYLVNGTEDHFVMPDDQLTGAMPSLHTRYFIGMDHMDIVLDPQVQDYVVSLIAELAHQPADGASAG